MEKDNGGRLRFLKVTRGGHDVNRLCSGSGGGRHSDDYDDDDDDDNFWYLKTKTPMINVDHEKTPIKMPRADIAFAD